MVVLGLHYLRCIRGQEESDQRDKALVIWLIYFDVTELNHTKYGLPSRQDVTPECCRIKFTLFPLVISTYYQNAVPVSNETGRGSWPRAAFGFEKLQPVRKARAAQGIPRHTLEGRNQPKKVVFKWTDGLVSFPKKREEKSLFQSRTTN